MYVTVGFYFGTEKIAPNLYTKVSSKPKWNQWLRSKTSIRNFPRV
jgi:hypothetical protein